MRTNKTLRIASILLIAVLMTSCIIGSTMAKYTSTVSGSSTGRVATWDIQFGSGETWVSELTFDLFDTSSDAGLKDETDAPHLIAPGTTNSITLPGIKNNSEVYASYKVDIAIEVTSMPTGATTLPFTFNGATLTRDGETNVFKGSVSEAAVIAPDQNIAGSTLSWTWDFDGADNIDNEWGKIANNTFTATVTVVAEQLDTNTIA